MAVSCGVPVNGAMASAINVLDDVHGGAGQQCRGQRDTGRHYAGAVNQRRRRDRPAECDGKRRQREQPRGAGEHDGQHHVGGLLCRTPRPPL